jgi:hypothetical protein
VPARTWPPSNHRKTKTNTRIRTCSVPSFRRTAFTIRQARNLEFTNVEIAYEAPDERSAFVVNDVEGADFFRIKTPPGSAGRVFSLGNVSDFRTLATRGVKDTQVDRVEAKAL